jgi:two-component system, sensor histidine kinase RegB
MAQGSIDYLNNGARSEWVRLRTLIVLRWMAITGQICAVIAATWITGLDLRLDLCALVIGLSAAFNTISTVVYPQNKRLSERTATLTLLFDLFQLAVLLAMCGGLTNPFAVLVLAPVIISATALTLRATLVVSISAVALVSMLAFFYWPLQLNDGTVLEQPRLFTYGMWASLVIGIIFTGSYARRVTVETFLMSQALSATQMALGREQRLTALGGVVAAAAHELGTPLATIKLAASELARELKNQPDLLDDTNLILSQTDRCRVILAEMGQRGKDDAHLRHAPISAVIEEAAEPHVNRGKKVILRVDGTLQNQLLAPDQPEISRKPEIIHGIRY